MTPGTPCPEGSTTARTTTEVQAVMAQRDYEEQPEAPDLGASVQLESEEHLAAPAGDRDGLDAGYSPPDRPYLAEEDAVTARGMREGDPLDQRLSRERGDEPGDDPGDADRSGRIEIAGEGAALETPDAMDGVDVGIDGGAAAAEEAAVHTTDDLGAPVEMEPSMAGSPALDDPELDAALDADPEADRAAAQAARDVRADGDVFDPGLPGELGEQIEDAGEPDADRIDRAPESGGVAAGASGRQDAGPGAWPDEDPQRSTRRRSYG
jgi:hypothetical protein